MNPEASQSVIPSLTVRDGAAALDFYARAFGAKELYRLPGTDGKLMHSEFQIGTTRIMLSDEFPDWGAFAPELGKGGSFLIYVPNADEAFKKAVEAGATIVQEPADQFWGDRTARVADPYGYRWGVAQHLRDLSPEEIAKAAAEWSPKKPE